MQKSNPSSIRISRHAAVGKPALWKAKDQLSQKQGPHATVYLINGDRYIGDWKNNQRHGKGIHFYKKTGYQYEGEFQNDQRSGYGTLSIPAANKSNSNNGHSLFDSSSKKSNSSQHEMVALRKVYTGAWLNDQREGFGTYFYPDNSIYQGNWSNDMKEGWGKLTYADGSIYEGEFHHEKRHGQGVLLLVNGDRYEGMWFNDKKEGPGKYVYLSKRLCLEGEWCDDISKCGTLRDLSAIPGHEKQYLIPEVFSL